MPVDPQEEARAVQVLVAVKKMVDGTLLPRDYQWPNLHWDRVSTQTCTDIKDLIRSKMKVRPPGGSGYDVPNPPETPRPVRIAWQLESVLAERAMDSASRPLRASILHSTIQFNVDPIYAFLRAARGTNAESFTFPSVSVLENARELIKAMQEVETMIEMHVDLDETEVTTVADEEDFWGR